MGTNAGRGWRCYVKAFRQVTGITPCPCHVRPAHRSVPDRAHREGSEGHREGSWRVFKRPPQGARWGKGRGRSHVASPRFWCHSCEGSGLLRGVGAARVYVCMCAGGACGGDPGGAAQASAGVALCVCASVRVCVCGCVVGGSCLLAWTYMCVWLRLWERRGACLRVMSVASISFLNRVCLSRQKKWLQRLPHLHP